MWDYEMTLRQFGCFNPEVLRKLHKAIKAKDRLMRDYPNWESMIAEVEREIADWTIKQIIVIQKPVKEKTNKQKRKESKSFCKKWLYRG